MSSLVEHHLFGSTDFVDEAIKTIQKYSRMATNTGRKLCVRFSGGKDSIVFEHLCKLAGVPYEARFSKTTVDPPELLHFIKKYYPHVIVDKPRITMPQLIIKKGFPPTRVHRYCCREFKERSMCTQGDIVVTGVRAAESKRRQDRKIFEACAMKDQMILHPILHWTDEQVWELIELEHKPYPSLYDEGFCRIGCVGCPLTSPENMLREFRRWPSFEKAYMWAFERMLSGRQFDKWKTAAQVMEWYIYGSQKWYQARTDQDQINLFRGEFAYFTDDIYQDKSFGDYEDKLNEIMTDKWLAAMFLNEEVG